MRAVTEQGIELGRGQTTRDPGGGGGGTGPTAAGRPRGLAQDKIRFPGLAGGLLAARSLPGRGSLSRQGVVESDGGRGRFDQIVGDGFAFLAAPEVVAGLGGTAAALERAGVRVVPLSASAADGLVADVDQTYQRWFAEHGWSAVIVRPDFYVFGAAGALGVEPRALAEDLLGLWGSPYSVEGGPGDDGADADDARQGIQFGENADEPSARARAGPRADEPDPARSRQRDGAEHGPPLPGQPGPGRAGLAVAELGPVRACRTDFHARPSGRSRCGGRTRPGRPRSSCRGCADQHRARPSTWPSGATTGRLHAFPLGLRLPYALADHRFRVGDAAAAELVGRARLPGLACPPRSTDSRCC